jgi:hypothetical protein
VRVPDGVKDNANVTISLSTWKEREVVPYTYRVEIIDPKTATAEALETQRQVKLAWKAKIEKVLGDIPFHHQDGLQESGRLSDWLDWWRDNYDMEVKVDPADFKVKDAKVVLDKCIWFKFGSKKRAAQYLKEWLEQVDATYVIREGSIQIVPLRRKGSSSPG